MVDVYYTYIPEWLVIEGGAKMDIAVSDQIEIWLAAEGAEWIPAASGDTVSHLFKSENRPEHMAAPKKTLFETIHVYFAEMPLLGYIVLILGITFGMVTFLSGKFSPSHN